MFHNNVYIFLVLEDNFLGSKLCSKSKFSNSIDQKLDVDGTLRDHFFPLSKAVSNVKING